MPSTISAGTTAGTAIAISGDTTGNLAFQTNNGTTAVTIDTSQQVGIGTVSPTAPLDVVTTSSALGIALRGRSSDNISNMDFESNDGATVYGQIQGRSTDFRIQSNSTLPTTFFTNGGERMRINSDGGVLVNTTAHYSSGRFVSYSASGVNAVFVNDDSTTNAIVTCRGDQATGNQIFIRFATNTNTERGSITYNRGGGVVAYNTTSDYRLKENIVDLPNALATVAQLKPRQFDWKETGNTTTGFIAHELAEVLPHAVSGEKDAVDEEGNPRYQGIDTSFLVATLTAAIQELKAELNEVKAELDATKAEVQALKGVA